MRNWKEWTEEEEQFLKDNYSILDKKTIEEKLKRNWDSIKARASKLSICRKKIVDLEIDQQVNRLTLKSKFIKNGLRYGLFKCSCGKEKLHEAQIWYVVKEYIRSCGCIKSEKDSKNCIERNTTHGMSAIVEYDIWQSMKIRCKNYRCKDYNAYGKRGIRFIEEWESFEQFYKDMGPRPSHKYHIGRKDHNWHYCKDNCRWITAEQESIDHENNIIILAWNEPKPLLWWLKDSRCQSDINTIKDRLKNGWSTEDAISKPSEC